MDKKEAVEKIKKLTDELNYHNHLYYVESRTEISDFEFDNKLKELQELENKFPELAGENSPTKRVGGDITKKFQTVQHVYPMLSLSNTYSQEEIVDWENRVKKLIGGNIEYVCELKYDGVAIGIRYEDGKFKQAVTRGDGTKGEDISNNVKTIKTIPLQLTGDYPSNFEIRGEIFFPLENFHKLNQQREKAGEDTFANPRNTASGTLKLQDSAVVANRGLDCFLYGVYGENLPMKGHFQAVEKAGSWGFKIPKVQEKYIKLTNSIEGIMDFINYWDEERANLPFEIDGVVIKVNDYSQQDELGFTAKSPRWAISYKFKTEQASAVLESVTYQVGRTGSVTPVANLSPISLGGTTVKRASLHNSDQMNLLDLHDNDTVLVEKGGEIIPKIVDVVKENRKDNAQKIAFITHCPECGTKLIRFDGEANHYCPNDSGCPPQIKGKITHFISRKAMDIDGLGSETIEQLYKENLIQNVSDLFKLKFDDLIKLERMGEKSANNLLEGVEKSKQMPFEKVLFALGIRYVGETVAKKLAKSLKNIDNLMEANYDQLISVDEIGEKIALSIQSFFNQPANRELVEELKAFGLQFNVEEQEQASNILEGKKIVISGVFTSFSRKEIKEVIELNGGKNVGSLSSKTDFLVAGENMGPAKLEKAKKLNIEILSEEEFKKMLGL